MIFITVNRSTFRGASQYLRAVLSTSGFLLLLLISIGPAAPAQNIQPRPVARLISESRSSVAMSRPRRVSEATTFSNAATPASPSFDSATAIERRAFEKTNEARVAQGLGPLTWDADLCRLAREHSESMGRQGYFSHVSLEGLQLKDRARASGVGRFRVIGENIAYNKGYQDAGGFAVERWMLSPGHRANILYVGFQASAIGSYISADGSVYLTQVFIAR